MIVVVVCPLGAVCCEPCQEPHGGIPVQQAGQVHEGERLADGHQDRLPPRPCRHPQLLSQGQSAGPVVAVCRVSSSPSSLCILYVQAPWSVPCHSDHPLHCPMPSCPHSPLYFDHYHRPPSYSSKELYNYKTFGSSYCEVPNSCAVRNNSVGWKIHPN